MAKLTRRELFLLGAGTSLAILTPPISGCGEKSEPQSTFFGGGPGSESPVGGILPAPQTHSTVYAVLGDELSDLHSMAAQSAANLGITKNSFLGETVFIKPNLVSLGLLGYDAMNGECTKAEIIAAVAEQCLIAGAAKVTIGDGAQGMRWDWSTLAFIGNFTIDGAANLADAVARLNGIYGDRVELVCLNAADRWEFVPSCSEAPAMKNGLMVAQDFYLADHVISLPVMKSHMWADITASMKNYVGLTPIRHLGTGFCRSTVHVSYAHATCADVTNAGIAGAFIDVVRWRHDEGKEDFAIIDCSIGVEGSGPHVPPVNPGKTIDIKQRSNGRHYYLLASRDFVALDTVVARAMNFATVKQLEIAERLGLGQTSGIILQGADPYELLIPNWKKPHRMSDDFFLFLDKYFHA